MEKNEMKPLMEFFDIIPSLKTDIKDKFLKLSRGLTINIDKKEDCDFDEEIYFLFENDKDLTILKEKMNNLIKLINNMDIEERKIFIKKELDDEMWKTF